ncbi:MAG: hydroxymethylbilane synthase [Actinobacteria bacterium]|nr:hydroxymethylbilane synthase [Actinomycetota bacterium]
MKDRRRLILGTRGSALALWQSNHVAARLTCEAGVEVELKKIKTKGDRILDAPLAKIGDKGLFVKEIENELLRGSLDLAVHSLKDMPTGIPAGLSLGAILEREDPRDALISRGGIPLDELPKGVAIGTSSLRRRAQLLKYRPDLKLVDVRGNLDTRVRKIEEGQFDGIILASAGLKRMGWEDRITERISPEVSLPAVGQGAIVVEVREDDAFMGELMKLLDHRETRAATLAERALMKRLEGGCQVPIGALGWLEGGALRLDGMVASLDGARLVRDSLEGDPAAPEDLGVALAERLLELGADDILAEVRAMAEVPEPVPNEGIH